MDCGAVAHLLPFSHSHHDTFCPTGFAHQYRQLVDFLCAQPDIANRIDIQSKVDAERTGQFVVRLHTSRRRRCRGRDRRRRDRNDDVILLYEAHWQGQGIVVTQQDKYHILDQLQDVLSNVMGGDW